MHQRQHKHVEQKQEKRLLVVDPHTVANPGTMMIHPDDAHVALAAVVRLWNFHALAVLADFADSVSHHFNFFMAQIHGVFKDNRPRFFKCRPFRLSEAFSALVDARVHCVD